MFIHHQVYQYELLFYHIVISRSMECISHVMVRWLLDVGMMRLMIHMVVVANLPIVFIKLNT
jgi:hypothetical protein